MGIVDMKKVLILLPVLLAACTTLPTSAEYLLRGDGYFADGKPQKALEAYNRALEINPDNLEGYASRGSVYFFTGDYDRAEQDFLYVLDKNPYQADAYTAYASTLAAKGDFQNALTVLDFAVRLKPDKPEIFFSRAGVYFMLGQWEDALRDYTSVINLSPAAEVFNARGVVYERLGKKDLAQQDFDMAKSGRIPAKLNVYSMID